METIKYAPEEEVQQLSEEMDESYRLGPGDIFSLQVWKRPEVSREQVVVAPDGQIAVPRIGYLNVRGMTVAEATALIAQRLTEFYEGPEVVMNMTQYENNKAFVLGRVEKPGVVYFSGKGTLMEALAKAGGLPIVAQDAFLTKCSIIRGKDKVIWIDLRDLLQNGNVALNARIKNNDIIFVPESEDELIYVMGEVVQPGVQRLKSKLSILDAIMSSGGPKRTANLSEIYVVRSNGGKGLVYQIDVKKMLARADFSANFQLKDNDIVYVNARGISKFNYFLEDLTPSVQFLDLTGNVLEKAGVMQEFRNEVWGQEGFVGD